MKQLIPLRALATAAALAGGLSAEAITYVAFYAGWPSAMSAAGVAKDVFQKP